MIYNRTFTITLNSKVTADFIIQDADDDHDAEKYTRFWLGGKVLRGSGISLKLLH
jgi:hypothetical protein